MMKIYTTEHFMYLHLLMVLFSGYNYIIAKRNKNIYLYLHDIFTKNDNFIDFIIFATKTVIIEECLFRVYLTEFIGFFCNNLIITKLLSSICFSIAHVSNYYRAKNLNVQNVRMTIAQLTYTLILSFCFLQQTTPLGSLAIHYYTNMYCLFTQAYLFRLNMLL